MCGRLKRVTLNAAVVGSILTLAKLKKIAVPRIKRLHGPAAQHLTVNVVGSMPIRLNELFLYPRSGDIVRRSVPPLKYKHLENYGERTES